MNQILRINENNSILLEIINAKKSMELIFEKLLQDISAKLNIYSMNDENTTISTQIIDLQNIKIEPIEIDIDSSLNVANLIRKKKKLSLKIAELTFFYRRKKNQISVSIVFC